MLCLGDFSELIFFTEENCENKTSKRGPSSDSLLRIFQFLYLRFQGKKLCSLHWLPVKFHVDFNLISKAIYGHAPDYLIDLIAIREQLRYNLHPFS